MSSQSAMFGELFRYRGLLGMLAWRDIRVRYKQSVLGIAWAFLMPLVQTGVMVLVFSASGAIKINEAGLNGMPYVLFVLSGVIAWQLFNATIASSMECLTRNARLVTKIYFPREVFPLSNVLAALVDFGMSLLIFVPFYLYFAWNYETVRPGPALLLLPLVVLCEVLLVAGLSMLLSMANLFFRDVKYIMTFVLQLWFFGTNIVYPIAFREHPQWQWVTLVNPMIPILNAYRDCLQGVGMVHSTWPGLGAAVGMSLAVFLIGWRVFHKAAFKFAEYV